MRVCVSYSYSDDNPRGSRLQSIHNMEIIEVGYAFAALRGELLDACSFMVCLCVGDHAEKQKKPVLTIAVSN